VSGDHGGERSTWWTFAFGSTLTLAMAVGTLLPFALGVLAPFIVPELELSRSRFGGLTTVFYLVGMPFSLVAGALVDRVGGRRVLLLLFLLGAAEVVLAGLAPDYMWLAAAAAVGGLATAAVNPVTNQQISLHVPVGRQGVIVGIKQSGVYAGLVFAGAALPLAAGSLGWRRALASTSVLGIVGVVATLLVIPPARRRMAGGGKGRTRTTLGADIWWLAGLTLLMGAVPAVTAVYLPLYAFEQLGLDEGAAGLLAAGSGAVAVVARIGWAHAAERIASARELLAVMAAVTLVALLLLWAAPAAGTWMLWLGALAFGGAVSAWTAVVYLALVRDVPQASAGRSTGVIQLAFYAGYSAYPLAFGFVVDRLGGYATGWLALVGINVVSLILLWAWRPVHVGVRPESNARVTSGSPG
jgi:predicted MFS family arabinose efflux permease